MDNCSSTNVCDSSIKVICMLLVEQMRQINNFTLTTINMTLTHVNLRLKYDIIKYSRMPWINNVPEMRRASCKFRGSEGFP